MHKIFKETIGYNLKIPFDVMKYSEAMARYGTDKPDRRYGLELVDLSQELKDSSFNVFAQAISAGGIVKGLNLKRPKELPRSRIDSLTEYVKSQGMGGLAYFKCEEKNEISGPISKFINDEEKKAIKEKMKAEQGDVIFILAGDYKLTNETLSRLRNKLALEEGLIKQGIFDFLWIIEFPLFAYNKDEKRWESEHHPFTAPFEEDIKFFDTDLGRIRSRSYDLVINGTEIGSGSIRIHRPDLQQKIFKVIGIGKEEAKDRFGFLVEALSFGAPPHGGIAPGIDRLIAMLAGCDSIRETIAFPKTQKAVCPLTNAPSFVSKKQLDELGLEIKGDSGEDGKDNNSSGKN
jgi:aspartyl-tRNA synthetase